MPISRTTRLLMLAFPTTDINEKFEQLRCKENERCIEHEFDLVLPETSGSRNRYPVDGSPYEFNRVKLPVGEDFNDYINASHISVGNNKYIATQGPKDCTVNHFWRMVEEAAATSASKAVVVMLTPTYEENQSTCAQYYPLSTQQRCMDIEEDREIADGWRASVSLDKSSKCNGYEVRKLTLQTWHKGGQSRLTEVEHYLFPEWPDFETPDQAGLILIDLIKDVSQTRLGTNGTTVAPLIVHCRAGLGRTGTFIGVYDLLTTRVYSSVYSGEYLYSPKEDLIFITVNKMRQHRKGLVQNGGQFTFIMNFYESSGKKRKCRTAKHE